MLRFEVYPIKAGKFNENLYIANCRNKVNFFVYKNDAGIAVIDCGFAPRAAKLQLDALGIDPLEVTHLFLTHSDFDHAGGWRAFGNANIYLSSMEEPLITRKIYRMHKLYNHRINKEYTLLSDGDTVQMGADRIGAISTPGHTPGSMCYIIGDMLFTGDALRLEHGRAAPRRDSITMDLAMQEESIRKLARLENIELVFTAHTGCASFDKAFGGF